MKYIFDILAFVGISLIGVGTWLIYPPSCFIAIGTLILIYALLGARRNNAT